MNNASAIHAVSGKERILEVRDLCLNIRNGRQTTPVLKHVSFELHRGQRLGIIGNSGAGKSMTMYALADLLPEKTTELSGSIVYYDSDRHDILKMQRREKRRFCSEHTAIILQDSLNALNPYRKIYSQMEENILHFHGGSREEAKKRIEEMLTVIGMPSDSKTLNKYPGQFSGGMRQRIAIAMALESNARILIADEPTTALDAINQMHFVRFLRRICEERELALMFISHNPGLVSMLCEEAVVLKEGSVIDRGLCAEVFERQRETFAPGIGKKTVICREQEADEAPDRQPVLELRAVCKRYVTKKRMGFGTEHVFAAVKDVSLELMAGETIGLVGESGCGKSTLAKIMVRLLDADAGDILYHHQSIAKMRQRDFRPLRPKLQLIQQNPFNSFDPEMRIYDILAEGVKAHHIQTDGASVKDYLTGILAECGLDAAYLTRYPHEFSGGQLQRLAIARAIALRPEIVIADEIVSALDVSVQNQILELLARLKKERQMSVIFISHDLCVVQQISDRILVMKDGKIVDAGRTKDIFEHSDCAYTLALKDAMVPSVYGKGLAE